MKGQLKLVRSLFQKACVEGVGGVSEKHVRIAHALTGADLCELQKKGNLSAERVLSLGADPTTIQETLAIIKVWIQGPSDELLWTHGITVTKINEGMSLVEYQEFDTPGED